MTTSSSLFSSDFSHGWNSNGHMFRVEMNSTGISSEPTYVFSIDGVKFDNFMDKSEAMRMPKQEEVSKRPSVTSKPAPSTATRNSSFTAQQQAPSVTPAATKVVANNDFDPFADSSSTNTADPFSASTAADPFAPTPAVRPAVEVDLFAPAPSAKPSFAASSFEYSGQSDDPFFSGESTQKKPFAPPVGAQATFASQAAAPARRQSAIEIMGDFAGLTAELPPPQPAPVMLAEPVSAPAPAAGKQAPVDPWSSLVDLDLNKKNPSEQNAQRRASINAGPALNSQMRVNNGGADAARRGSMPSIPSNNINPFGPPAAPQNGGGMGGMNNDPFAAAQPYQQQQPFGAAPQYGLGMGGGAGGMAPNPFGPGPSGAGGMGGPYGGNSMNAGYGGGAAGMGGGYGAPANGGMGSYQTQQRQPPTKRSSLDSLDPFKM